MKNEYLDITECLERAAQTDRGATVIYSENEQITLSYRHILENGKRLSAYLRKQGIYKSEYALIYCSDVKNLIYSFWTCAVGGYTAIMAAYSPREEMNREFVEQHGFSVLLTDVDAVHPEWFGHVVRVDKFSWDDDTLEDHVVVEHNPEDILYVQFSSGTTGNAKEIPIKRKNVSANLQDEMICLQVNDRDVVVNWQPLTHSGGLVIFHMMAVMAGINQYCIPDSVYVKNPLLWMEMIHRYRGTITGTVPFALRRFVDVFQRSDSKKVWDLSCLKTIILGAEHVSPDLFSVFTTEMKQYQMKPSAVVPAYGLSEATCLLGYAFTDGTLETYMTEHQEFIYGDAVIKGTDDVLRPKYILYKSLSNSVDVKITDESRCVLPIGTIGKIWIKGDAVIDGYLNNHQVEAGEHFDEGWYNTGDLGALVKERQLVVMGRAKEIVVSGGVNYGCTELENVIKSIEIEGFTADTIICNVLDSEGMEQIIAFAACDVDEDSRKFWNRFVSYKNAVRDTVFEKFGVVIEQVVPIQEIPKSKSGKVHRIELSTNYAEGKYAGRLEQMKRYLNQNRTKDLSTKEVITDIIYELLGIKVTNYDLTFQEYGIVSRNIIELVERCNEALHTNMKASDIFNYPTISDFIGYASMLVKNQTGDWKEGENQKSDSDKLEDIAIVGMSCRFPNGANSVEEFWDNLVHGIDGITEVPEGRWDKEKYYSSNKNEPGKMYCKQGGFLNVPIDEFDAGFFHISPKEAAAIDPQARLLLELTYEAFENGGMNIAEYSGTKTGVFVGASADDYSGASISSGDLTRIDSYSLTGVCHSTICGRISYVFGFEGACLSVNTACSSALTALHIAADAIKNHDIDVAVVGGTNLIMSPAISIAFSKLQAVSPNGHCRSFDADADGYVRGEGAGVILLKRLSDAQRNHDNILGILKGTGINQDGKSNGLTAPNGASQKKLIIDTLHKLNIDPGTIGYVEAHGTGTPLGDPIEVNALIDAYGKNRDAENPLLIGSVKSNIGHLEAAAGMASVIKVLLAFRHKMIPGNLNYHTPNPEIRWEDAPLKVVVSNTEWNSNGRIRRAAVDSFGFGGSNAHVILEEYRGDAQEAAKESEAEHARKEKPEMEQELEASVNRYMLKVTAQSEDGVKKLAGQMMAVLKKTSDAQLDDLILTANQGRADYASRLVVCGKNRDDLIQGMNAYTDGRTSADTFCSDGRKTGQIVFMFTGQGSQYVNMGRYLYHTNLCFQKTMKRCDELFRPYLLISILDLIYSKDADDDMVNNTTYAQPLIFSIEYALAEMWQSYGIMPSIVLGHSIGEYAAAVTAGIMTLETAVELVACRGRLMGAVPGSGTMATIFADEETVKGLLDGCENSVIAVKNAKANCVVSGEKKEVETVCAKAAKQGIRTRLLKVSHAFHSPMMRPAAKQFEYIAQNKNYKKADIEFVSTVYARSLEQEEVLGAEYWTNQILNPVQFYQAITSIEHTENLFFLEIGATNTLSSLCRLIFDDRVTYAYSLNRTDAEDMTLCHTFASLYVHGIDLDWKKIYRDRPAWTRVASLPNYPFERERYWKDVLFDRKTNLEITGHSVHSLLGQRIESVCMEDTVIFQREYHWNRPFFMGEHIIFDTAIAPAASYVSILISAMKELRNPKSIIIQNMELREPLIVNEDETRLVQICIGNVYHDTCDFKIASRLTDGVSTGWTIHSQGTIVVNDHAYLQPEETIDVQCLEEAGYDTCADEDTEHPVYRTFAETGFQLGIGFRRVKKSRCQNHHGFCYIEPYEALPYEEDYDIYPGVVDSIFHTMLCVSTADGFMSGQGEHGTTIPYFITKIGFNYHKFETLWCSSSAITENNSFIGGSSVYNSENQMIMQIDHMITRLTNENRLITRNQSNNRLFYHCDWKKIKEAAIGTQDIDEVYAILDRKSDLEMLRTLWEKQNRNVHVICPGEERNAIPKMLSQIRKSRKKAVIVYAIGWNQTGLAVDDICLHIMMELSQGITKYAVENLCRVRIVTHHACPFENTDMNFSQSLLWGFSKVFGMEYEQSYAGIMDLDDLQAYGDLNTLAGLVLFGKDFELCVRGEAAYVSRVEKLADYLKQTKITNRPIRIFPEQTYLVAGGTGALGMTYIEALVESGAKHIAVICRKEPKEEVKRSFDAMREHGIELNCYFCDICQEARTKETIIQIETEMPRIGGIINAGGVIRDKLIHDLSWEDYEYVLNPKVSGSMNLYRSVADHALDFFLMLSSITSIMGNMGQSNYAAANVFMNTFAQYLNQIGQNGYVFCWGPWSSQGMATDEIVQKSMETRGIRSISKEQGKQIILEFFKHPYQELIVADIHWNRFAANVSGNAAKVLLEKLVTNDKKSQKEASKTLDLTGLSKEALKLELMDYMQTICMKVMGYSAKQDVNTDSSFGELGADSLMMFSIRSEVNKLLSTEISVSVLYSYDTIDKLVDYLLDEVIDTEQVKEPQADSGKKSSKTKVYFLPYAGGSVHSYTKWKSYLTDEYEAVFLEYPGRGSRTGEPFCETIEELAEDLYKQFLNTVGDSDYRIFGHSLGGLVAYELTRKIQLENRKLPEMLFISGREPTNYSKIIKDISEYPDMEFLELMSVYGGIPNELYMDESLRELFLPVLRADFKLLERYKTCYHTDVLDCRAMILYGTEDANMIKEELMQWKNYFSQPMELVEFAGEHFYCLEEENSKRIMEYIQKQF